MLTRRVNDVLVLDHRLLGTEVQWLDDKGTVYVPQKLGLKFRGENATLVVWWHSAAGESGLRTGEILKRDSSNRISNLKFIPVVPLKEEGDRIEFLHLDGAVEVLVLRSDFWIVKGKESYQGSILIPEEDQ